MAGTEGTGRAMGFDVRRAGRGLKIAAVGGVFLLIALVFMHWYSFTPNHDIAPVRIDSTFFAQATPPLSEPPPSQLPSLQTPAEIGAWSNAGFLGILADLVLLGVAFAAIGLPAARAGGRGSQVDAGTVLAALGVIGAVVVVLRMIFPVDVEIGPVKFDTNFEAGIYVALVAAIVIAIGGFIARRETAPATPAAPPPAT